MDERQTSLHPAEPEYDAGAAALAPAELDNFRITHARQIGDILRQLMQRKEYLTAECHQAQTRMSTRILAVDQDAGHFIYDASTEPGINQRLTMAPEVYFSSSLDGIRIQFVSAQTQLRSFEDHDALFAPLPKTLFRVQRREFFRAIAPLAEAYSCRTVLTDQRHADWEIVDISLDGLGLRSKTPGLSEMPIGTLLGQAVLNFGKRGTITTDLIVTNQRNIRSTESPVYRVGCRFVKFPKTKEQELQRLVTYLELARRGMPHPN